MSARRWRGSIITKILPAAVALVLLPVIIWGYSWYHSMLDRVADSRLYSAQRLAGQISQSLEQKIGVVTNFSGIIVNDSGLIQLAYYGARDSEAVNFLINDYKPLISLLKYQVSDVSNVRVLHSNPNLFNVNNLIYYCDDLPQRIEALAGEGGSAVSLVRLAHVAYAEKGHYYPFTRFSRADEDVWYISQIVDSSRIANPRALLEISVDNRQFTRPIRELALTEGEGVALVTWSGQIPCAAGDTPIAEVGDADLTREQTLRVASGGASYTVAVQPCPSLRASVMMFIREGGFALNPTDWENMLLTLAAVILGLVLLAMSLSVILVRRLHALAEAMDSFRPGQRVPALPESGRDEIARLIRHFHRMADRLTEASAKERALVQAELIGQIRPHFVLNALDMLRLRADEKGEADLAQCALKINRYFRHTMMDGSRMITLSDEIRSVQNYVALINDMRVKPIRCMVLLDAWAESAADGVNVPALLLQPLVENAVKHGISPDTSGSIHLEVSRRGENMVISMEDSGRGMDEAAVARLNALSGGADRPSDGAHIGVSNVARRLWLNYGGAASIRFESAENVGVRVEIAIPVLRLRPALRVASGEDDGGPSGKRG